MHLQLPGFVEQGKDSRLLLRAADFEYGRLSVVKEVESQAFAARLKVAPRQQVSGHLPFIPTDGLVPFCRAIEFPCSRIRA